MKVKKVAKLLIFCFYNFKACCFKQGHKTNLCLNAYNPSHTAVLSAEGCHDLKCVWQQDLYVMQQQQQHSSGTCIISFHHFSPTEDLDKFPLSFVPFQQLEKTGAKLLG